MLVGKQSLACMCACWVRQVTFDFVAPHDSAGPAGMGVLARLGMGVGLGLITFQVSFQEGWEIGAGAIDAGEGTMQCMN